MSIRGLWKRFGNFWEKRREPKQGTGGRETYIGYKVQRGRSCQRRLGTSESREPRRQNVASPAKAVQQATAIVKRFLLGLDRFSHPSTLPSAHRGGTMGMRYQSCTKNLCETYFLPNFCQIVMLCFVFAALRRTSMTAAPPKNETSSACKLGDNDNNCCSLHPLRHTTKHPRGILNCIFPGFRL